MSVFSCLAGLSLFLTGALLVYWLTQRTHSGFGLWVGASGAMAVAYLLVALDRRLPAVPSLVAAAGCAALAATLRLEGVRRLMGARRFAYPWLALPVIALGAAATFAYVTPASSVPYGVVGVCFGVPFLAAAALLLSRSRKPGRRLHVVAGALFGVYGAVILAHVGYWLGRWQGGIDLSRTTMNVGFFFASMLFDVLWAVLLLTWNSWWMARELRLAQAAAERGRRQLAELVSFLPDATFAVDKQGLVIAWNRALEEMSGVAAEEVMGKPYSHAIRQFGDRQEALIDWVFEPSRRIGMPYRSVHRQGDAVSAEVLTTFRKRPERPLHLWMTAKLLRNEEGEITGAIESMRDVTEHKRAERTLRERMEQLQALFELSLDGILVVGQGGVIEDANPAACRLVGRSKEEICSLGYKGLVRSRQDVEDQLEVRSVIGGAADRITVVKADGSTFEAECTAVGWRDARGAPHGFLVFRDITDKLEAQRILKESEIRLLQAQAIAQLGRWEIDIPGRCMWYSKEAKRIFGLDDRRSLFPLDMGGLMRATTDWPVVKVALERAMAGRPLDLEYRIRRLNDGALRVIHAYGRTEFAASGEPRRVVGVFQDVTDLRRIEESPRFLTEAARPQGEWALWLDQEGRVVRATDSACAQLGRSREELEGCLIFALDQELKAEEWSSLLDRIDQEGEVARDSLFLTAAGGQIRAQAAFVRSSLEGEKRVFVAARDVSVNTEVREAAAALARSYDLQKGAVFCVEGDGRIVYTSDSLCQKLGYSQEEFSGLSIYDLDMNLSRDWREQWELVHRRGSYSTQSMYRTKAGREIPMDVRVDLVRTDGREYALVYAADTTQERQLISRADDQAAALRESVTLEAIERLAGGIAHDLNSLLTVILGYGDLVLADGQVKDSPVRRDVEEIKAAAERARLLTRQVLAFAQQRTLHEEIIDVGAMVEDLVPALREELGPAIVLEYLRPTGEFYVETDPGLLRESLLHMIGNSRDAMPTGGRVTIAVGEEELGGSDIPAVSLGQPGFYVVISVSDTGEGMSPDVLAHVFEPFFTTKEAGAGLGLGLSMVHGFVKQSGGFISVSSEVGEGTTFRIYLPKVPQSLHLETATPTCSPEKQKETTILVVEDEEGLRRLIARVLEGQGYRVVVAGSGPEALETLDGMVHPPDLLLTDVILPGGMRGDHLAEEVSARFSGMPVLYMSGHTRGAYADGGRIDEASNFLAKPFTPDTLLAKIREMLGPAT